MRITTHKTVDIMVPLFKSLLLIRPVHLYGNADKRYLIEMIENIQRHFTKRILGMKPLKCNDRLCSLKLPSLELRGDIIEVYNLIHSHHVHY